MLYMEYLGLALLGTWFRDLHKLNASVVTQWRNALRWTVLLKEFKSFQRKQLRLSMAMVVPTRTY